MNLEEGPRDPEPTLSTLLGGGLALSTLQELKVG